MIIQDEMLTIMINQFKYVKDATILLKGESAVVKIIVIFNHKFWVSL